MDPHINEDQLRRFFSATLSRTETAGVIRHLLTQCATCRATATAIADSLGIQWLAGTYRERLRPLPVPLDALLSRERVVAMGQWATLQAMPWETRRKAVASEERFHTLGFFDLLRGSYLERAREDPLDGLHTAELALEVAQHLSPRRYGRDDFHLPADAVGAALAERGNAKRLAADFAGAEADLLEAQRVLEQGSDNPREGVRVLSLHASLLRDLGLWERSAERLDDALVRYHAMEDDRLIAQTLIQKASTVGYIEPAHAFPILEEALVVLAGGDDPRLELLARHNLTWFLIDEGKLDEAVRSLEDCRPLYELFEDAWTQLRRQWVEARLARALGHLDGARMVFRLLIEAFEKRSMHHEATLVAIELAEAYAASEKHEEALALVQGFYARLRAWGLHKEGLAVWLLFARSVEGVAKQDAFRKVTLYVLRAWRHPLAGGAMVGKQVEAMESFRAAEGTIFGPWTPGKCVISAYDGGEAHVPYEDLAEFLDRLT